MKKYVFLCVMVSCFGFGREPGLTDLQKAGYALAQAEDHGATAIEILRLKHNVVVEEIRSSLQYPELKLEQIDLMVVLLRQLQKDGPTEPIRYERFPTNEELKKCTKEIEIIEVQNTPSEMVGLARTLNKKLQSDATWKNRFIAAAKKYDRLFEELKEMQKPENAGRDYGCGSAADGAASKH